MISNYVTCSLLSINILRNCILAHGAWLGSDLGARGISGVYTGVRTVVQLLFLCAVQNDEPGGWGG